MKKTYTTYRVRTNEKKNVFTTSTYTMPDKGTAANKTFYIKEIYRWGEAVLEVEGDDALEQSSDPYERPLLLDNYTVIDQNFDDGCSLEFEFEEDDDWTEKQKKYVTDLFENESYTGFDDKKIYCDDYTARFYGPLDIEKESVEEREVVEKRSWPF